MAPTHIRVTVYKAYGLPWKVLGNSCGCFATISLWGVTRKTQVISRLAPNDSLEWTNEHHNFRIPADFSSNEALSSAEIVIKGFSFNLISYPVKEELLGSNSMSLSNFKPRDAAVPKLYKLTGAVIPDVNMKLGVAISFVDFTEQPKQARSRFDSAPSEPDALNKKINNRNGNNFLKLGSLDNLGTVTAHHLERSEPSDMLTDQRHLRTDFITLLDQSYSMMFSPTVTSSPAAAAFGGEISVLDDTTLADNTSDDGEQQEDHLGMGYGNGSDASDNGDEDFTLGLRSSSGRL